jgi:hypothetical protein
VNDQIIHRPFVVSVGSGEVNGQRSTFFIHQNMDFGSRFAAIGWILPGLTTSQGSWNHFTVHRLPFPANFLLVSIVFHQYLEQLVENPFVLPRLKTFM